MAKESVEWIMMFKYDIFYTFTQIGMEEFAQSITYFCFTLNRNGKSDFVSKSDWLQFVEWLQTAPIFQTITATSMAQLKLILKRNKCFYKK